MLTTPTNGILLLSSLSFITIGVVGWLSLSEPDRSARLWLSAFVLSGLSPLLGAGSQFTAFSFVASTLALTASFAVFSLSLKTFRNDQLLLREYSIAIGAGLVLYTVVLGYLFKNASIAAQATAFALGNGAMAVWATSEAVQLTKRHRSRFAAHLAVIFGIQAAVLTIRIPQVWFGAQMRLSDSEPIALSIVLVLALCGIIKAISYYAMRLEEFQIRIQRDTEIVRDQALRLARKNSELVSAMHVAPVACAVTDPTLKVIYLNAEARRMLGDFDIVKHPPRLSDWLVGLQRAQIVSIASSRYVFVRAPDWSELMIAELSVRGVESESPGTQWVFLIKPEDYSQSVIEAAWTAIPREEDRALLLTDDHGLGLSAQPAWGEVLGPYAVFNSPELRFGGISDSQDAAGLDVWATLTNFCGDQGKLERARSEQRAGRGTSILLRDSQGQQVNVIFTPIRSKASKERRWLYEIFWKPAPIKTATPATTPVARRATHVAGEPVEPRSVPATDIPAFLKK